MGDFDHWNYRVLKRTALTATGEDQSFELIEVDYDKRGKITAWWPAAPGGHNLKALEADLRRMTKAAWYAVLRAEGKRCLTVADLPARGDCDCSCHAVVQPGLVPCPKCEHSSRTDAPGRDT